MKGFTDRFDSMVIEGFATSEECDALVSLAEAGQKNRATVGPERRVDPKIRNNTTSHIDKQSYGVENVVRKRIDKLLQEERGVDVSKSEPVQVQIYEPGEHYSRHTDSWSQDEVCAGTAQRTWTCVLYLNHVEKGGSTSFPRVKAKVMPDKGKLVCWNNLDENMQKNTLTEHQGDQVEAGKKWLANFWYNLPGDPVNCKSEHMTGKSFSLETVVAIVLGGIFVLLIVWFALVRFCCRKRRCLVRDGKKE